MAANTYLRGYSIERLRHQLGEWVQGGIPRVKMKIGRHPGEDVARVRAAREAIGPDADLFVDANGAYDRKQALAMADAFAKLGVSWFEEPAKRVARRVVDVLRKDLEPGIPLVGLEPSCVSVFRDEVPELFPNDTDVERLQKQSLLLSEFLVNSPYTTGGIGLLGTAPSSEAMQDCDTLVMIGTSFPYMEFLPKPGQAKCVQIDIDPARIGLRHPAHVALQGDAKEVLDSLLPMIRRKEDRSFLRKAQDDMEQWRELLKERGTREDRPMKPQVVAYQLNRFLHDDAIKGP